MVGIALGIALGVGIVTAFVFLGSEETIDAPRLSGDAAGTVPAGLPFSNPVPLVRVVDGGPPASGPARLDVRQGESVRFRVRSDAPVVIRVPAYGISEIVDPSLVLSFRARRAGRFAVLVAGSDAEVATVRVRSRRP